MFQAFKSFFEKRVNIALGLLSGGALFIAGIILFIEVVCRFSGHPTDWIPETSVYLFAGAMMLGSAYTLMRGKHVRVELLTCRLSPRSQDILYLLTSLFGMAFCLLVVYYAAIDFIDVIETGETTATPMRVPLWLTEMPISIGFFLVAIQFFIHAGDRVIRLQQGSPLEGLKMGGGH